MDESLDIAELAKDQIKFNNFVYTPLSEAVSIIKKRWEDKLLEEKVNEHLIADIPSPLTTACKAVLFRQIATPNLELIRFINLIQKFDIEPTFLEYHEDIYTSVNPIKRYLGKLRILRTVSQSRTRVTNKTIIDFNQSQGRKISEVQTVWGQPLTDFHHSLLNSAYPDLSKYVFDASSWFHRMGDRAKDYYLKYIALFIRNGICFENFILKGDELAFVKRVFLPNFIKIWKLIGVKPLFVELLPKESQDDLEWISYDSKLSSRFSN